MSKHMDCTRAGNKTNFTLDSRCCLHYACMKTRRNRCRDYQDLTDKEKQVAVDWLSRNGYEVHEYVKMQGLRQDTVKDRTTSKESSDIGVRRAMLEV